MEERSKKTIQVKCRDCKKRLFDISTDAEGIISIKCAKCGAVVSVSMHHKHYRCKRQIVTRE
jgi:phage FluMu protein Com